MNRRGFLGSILAAGVAPAIVRIENLMGMVPTESGLLVPRSIEDLWREDLHHYQGVDWAAGDDMTAFSLQRICKDDVLTIRTWCIGLGGTATYDDTKYRLDEAGRLQGLVVA